MDEIQELLMSKDNMKSALSIEKALLVAKEQILQEVFDATARKVQIYKPDAQRLNNGYDYAYNDFAKIHEFYIRKDSSYPEISYLYKSKIKPNVDIWVRMEVKWDIFVGYVTPFQGECKGKQITKQESIDLFGDSRAENWWAYWELLNEPHCESLDFKQYNESWLALFESDALERFTDHCAKRIVEMLEY